MYYETLIGKPYFEEELYEVVLFELEKNTAFYFDKYFHLKLEILPNGKFVIKEIVYFTDRAIAREISRNQHGKVAWFKIRGSADQVTSKTNSTAHFS